MKRPIKPKIPKKPVRPEEFHSEMKLISNVRINSVLPMVACSIEDFAKKFETELKKEIKRNEGNDFNFDNVVIKFYDNWSSQYKANTIDIFRVKKHHNPSFKKEMKSYHANMVKHNNAVVSYGENKKQYEINIKLWKAFKLKDAQDKLKDELSFLTSKIKNLEEQKEKLLADTLIEQNMLSE